ncbi:hypothetical protein GCM10023194_39440 [Planotetraspora phitsanulokensis]|uniref:Uncharacterized protein n=1 Tax=Planotetraspora phitsanulokensis TaxID=575192 RepID=A0A8J3UA16_9ACTN|nr:DUF6461 domain-containing protein [Planotetraspora phitsanulokensis]GII41529.1 hypothetical protein Pph01_65320 [Planotetraspora phitsanulokensis]
MTSTGAYSWLGEAFCLTAATGIDAGSALARCGALDAPAAMTLEDAVRLSRSFDAGYPRLCLAKPCDKAVLLLEMSAAEGARPEVLRALSAETQAMSVLVAPEACHVALAVDGELVAGLDARNPSVRWGSDPGRLSLDSGQGACGALRLLESFAGTPLTETLFAEPVTAAPLRPLLEDPPSLSGHEVRQLDPELARLLDRSDDATLRHVAVDQARWCARRADVADEPLISAALDAGMSRLVEDTESLGLLIRSWNEEGHVAGASLADPVGRDRMTAGLRRLAFLRAHAGNAVRAAMFPDARTAAYCALSSLVTERIATRRQDVLRLLGQ